MCRDLKTESGGEVAWDYSWGELFSSLFVPAWSHWMHLKSLTQNLGQHVAWGHLNFKSAAIFLLVAIEKRRALCLQSVSWSPKSGTGNFSSGSNLFVLCWRKYVRSVMSLNWHFVFWLWVELGITWSDKDESLPDFVPLVIV